MSKKRLFLCMLAILLFLPSFLVNATPEELADKKVAHSRDGDISSKDEVVYATLSDLGEVEEIYVVNILDVSKAGSIIDYGSYASITNLTDLSHVEQIGDAIRLEAPAGKFYYQGNMIEKELPWQIIISYWLDGQELQPEELAGKEGRLQISIRTTANEKVDASFYENYLLQISLLLDAARFSQIEAPEATMANVGKKKQMTYTVMPGQEGEIRLAANVIDLELQGIEIAALPASFSIALPDIDELQEEMSALAEAIQEVNEGVSELERGVSELNSGVSSLRNGSAAYQEGMEELNGASPELAKASARIDEALTLISSSLRLNAAEMDMAEWKELTQALSQLAQGLHQIADGLKYLQDNYSLAYTALDHALQAIPAYALTEGEIEDLYRSGAEQEILDQLLETYTAAQTAKGTYLAVQDGFAAVESTLVEMSGAVREMGHALALMESQLATSLDDMESFDSLLELEKGLAELSSSYTEFHAGLVSYTDGVALVSDSYQKLHGGVVELSEGTEELEAGVKELASGTHSLSEATNELPEQMQEEIDHLMADYANPDFEVVSFVSAKNNKMNSVQFVIKTEGIMKKQDEIVTEEKEEIKGFWSRLLELFF